MSKPVSVNPAQSVVAADWEEVSCPTCGPAATSRLLFTRADGHGIRWCDGCRLIFMSPRFTPARLAAIYEHAEPADLSVFENFDYAKWKQQTGFAVHALSSYKVKGLLLDLIGQYLKPGARLLDVGCGFGLAVYEARQRGFDAEGIDISNLFLGLARAKLGLNLHQGRVEDQHFPTASFDGTIFWDVLEHVHNPLEILAELRRVTRPGGFLFGQVPNWRGLTNRYKTFLNRHGFARKQFKHFGLPHHIFIFDEASLRQMLAKAGYKLIYCRSWSKLKYKLNPSWLARRFHTTLERRNLTDYIAFVATPESAAPA